MNNSKYLYFHSLAVIFFFIFGVQTVFGEEISKDVEKITESKLENSFAMPMLNGNIWKTMSHDSKIAFMWGFGHVVTVEGALMHEYPELKRDGFVSKTMEGMKNTSMNDVVEKINSYYKSHPEDINVPVINVIWKIIVKPNVSTGIGGRPLGE